jgi:hypothetical protein
MNWAAYPRVAPDVARGAKSGVNQTLIRNDVLFEIVNHATLAHLLEGVFHELNVHRMYLIVIMRLLRIENQIERDLIRLIHHGPVALYHPSDMEALHSRNRPEVLLGTRDQFIGRLGILWISPENNNMRKHPRQHMKAAPPRQRFFDRVSATWQLSGD